MKKYLFIFLFFIFSFQCPLFAMMRNQYCHQKHNEEKRARQQEKINNRVIQTVLTVYEKINHNWSLPQDSGAEECLRTESTYWTAKWVKGSKDFQGRKIERQFPTLVYQGNPEEIVLALDDLINKRAYLECFIAVNVVKIIALKELLGDAYFISYITSLMESPTYDPDALFHGLPMPFMKECPGKGIPGSFGYYANLPLYFAFKPQGLFGGENLCCVKENQYLGFGDFFKNGAQCLENIEMKAYRDFYNDRDVQREREQHQKYCSLMDEALFIKKIRDHHWQENNNYSVFDYKIIKEYKKTRKF